MPSRSDRLRHLRKYAEGNLGNRSFFFRGPGNRLNLRAQNLSTFCDLVAEIDDETFLFHLQRGDYTSWIRSVIKDDDLATEIEEIRNDGRPPDEGRALLTDAIDRRYALR